MYNLESDIRALKQSLSKGISGMKAGQAAILTTQILRVLHGYDAEIETLHRDAAIQPRVPHGGKIPANTPIMGAR